MFEAEVQAGIALLDKKAPLYWRTRLDQETFDITSATNCILGQVYKRAGELQGITGYSYGVDQLGCMYPQDFGFMLARDRDYEEWATLQDAWIAALWPESE